MSKSGAAIDFSNVFKSYESVFPKEFLENNPFAKWFEVMGSGGFDAQKMMREHQDRLEALTLSNQQAALAYKAQIERQTEIFDAVMKAAADSIAKLDLSPTPEAAAKNLAIYSQAIETATKLMQRLSEETAAATQDAYAKIAKEVEAAISSLRVG